MYLLASLGVTLLVLMTFTDCLAEGKRAKKYIGENGGDFEFIDEVSSIRLPAISTVTQ